MPKLMIMAGGTGGHIFPGLAVAEALQAKGWDIIWLGTADRMEADIIPQHGIPFYTIDIQGIRRNGLLKKITLPIVLCRAVWQARTILKQTQPDVVLGMGGYASGPGGLAAKALGLPLFIHEQNAVLGLTNRWLAKIANHVFTGFAINIGEAVGNPVRAAFNRVPALQLNADQTLHILVVGGSLGAQVFNETLPTIFANYSNIVITHQCGRGNVETVNAAYATHGLQTQDSVVEFIEDMPTEFAQSHLLICRAGALTVAEVAAAGRAAIFVPLPSAVDDHQTHNALYLAKRDAGLVIAQSTLTAVLPNVLDTLLSQPQQLIEIAQQAKACARLEATQHIVTALEQAA